MDWLQAQADASVQLTVTSPPYNLGKEYEAATDLATYLANMAPLIGELCRVTSERGSICWQTGNYVAKGEIYPLDLYFYQLFKAQGFKLRNRIIWHYGHGLHCTKRFSGRYETLLWFTKTDSYTFNLDPVRVPSKYPGKRHYKGARAGQLSGNPLGKNPSDFWEFLRDEWAGGSWDVPNVKSNHPEKTIHPCQFPVEVAERCVLALSDPGDTVADPYAGAGSTLLAALKHDRNALGGEMYAPYVELAQARIDQLLAGTLVTREIGTPIHAPSGKLAQRPSEWGQDE